ncbi:MAG TPA: hypothetical protein PK886_00470 [Candidatus Paceibacterota bacterium]|nr:hypothetical protein [Candidatus Paceibacterota bacterium]
MKKDLSNEENKLAQEMVDNSEKPNLELSKEGSVFDKGNERFNAVSNTISLAKEKAASFFKKTGSRISNFFKKTTVGVLSIPEIVEKGAEKYEEIVSKGVYFTGNKITEGTNFAIEKIDQGVEFVDSSVAKSVDWVEDRIKAVRGFVGEGVEFGKDVSFYLSNKTADGLENIKNGISHRYKSAIEFGIKSINGAKELVRSKKESFNNWRNEIRKERLAREIEKNISEVSFEIGFNREEMEKRAKNFQILNNRLNELLEAKNALLASPQAVAV